MKDADEISQLIEDIWNVRIAKLRMSSRDVLQSRVDDVIPDNGGIYSIRNFTQLEINFIRTLFLRSLTNSYIISRKQGELEQRAEINIDQSTNYSQYA